MNPLNSPIHPSERLVLTPSEFAAALGRRKTWVYRQISAGKIKVIIKQGRKLIPLSELDQIMQNAKGGPVRA
jgi:hypothetical protein